PDPDVFSQIDATNDGGAVTSDAPVTMDSATIDANAIDAAVADTARDAFVPDANTMNPGSTIDHQRWEPPCGMTVAGDERLCSNLVSGGSCPGAYRPVDKTFTFGGTPGAHYSVTLHLRGVVELKTYTGGTASGSHFLSGGMPISGVVNTYGFSVTSPQQT